MIDKNKILKHVDMFPTLPFAVSNVMKLLNDPSASAAKISDAIKPDPALTGNLLKIVNSAFFGLRKDIVSVKHAATLLGTKRLFEVTVAAALTPMVPKEIPGYNTKASQFWSHSVATAVLAEQIAKIVEIKEEELAFTSALLHDIGKLVIGSFLQEEEQELLKKLQSMDKSFVEIETDILGANHAEIGGDICDRWSLPQSIGMAIRWHHDPSANPDIDTRHISDLINIANGLSYEISFGNDQGELRRQISENAIERLGIKVQQLEQAASDSMEHIKELSSLFRQ